MKIKNLKVLLDYRKNVSPSRQNRSTLIIIMIELIIKWMRQNDSLMSRSSLSSSPEKCIRTSAIVFEILDEKGFLIYNINLTTNAVVIIAETADLKADKTI